MKSSFPVCIPILFAVTTLTAFAAEQFAVEQGHDAGPCMLSSPKALIGFSGQDVSFNCTVCAERVVVFWILDGQDSISLRNGPLQPRSEYLSVTDEGTTSHFTFTATQERNHTVSCKVVYGAEYRVDISDPVTISVQGTLAAPGNVRATIKEDEKEITLNWTPPPSIAEVDHYNIAVYTGSASEKVVVHRPEYTLNVTRCDNQVISVSVCASNNAGEGNFSTPINITNYCIQTIAQEDCSLDLVIILLVLVVVAVLVVANTMLVGTLFYCYRGIKRKATVTEEHKAIALKSCIKSRADTRYA